MKHKIFIPAALFFASLFLYSCNDTGYEIEKEETTSEAPKTETHTEIKQDVEQPKTDIKQETNIENKIPTKVYFVQLGAFSKEQNAQGFIKKLSKLLNYDFSYDFVANLFKVRTEYYSSRSEAVEVIQKIVDAGFQDAFLKEINK